MEISFNPIFGQWEAWSDDGYVAAWGDTKEEAIRALQENIKEKENNR